MKDKQLEERTQKSWADQLNEDSHKNAEKGLLVAESFIKKYYLDEMSTYEVNSLTRPIREATLTKTARLYKLSSIVFNKSENVLDKLNNVYSALHSLNLSLIMLITSSQSGVDFYFGVKVGKGQEIDDTIAEAFEKSFRSNFPGSEINTVDIQKFTSTLNRILPQDGTNAVTALTSIPALKDAETENRQFTQGIEKMIDTMQGTEYSILIISDPVNKNQLAWTKQGYEELYTELFPLAESELTIGKSDATSISTSEMEGLTETIGTSVSKTQSFTKGKSSTKSESRTNTIGMSMGAFDSVGASRSSGGTLSGNVGLGFGKKSIFNIGAALAGSVMEGIASTVGVNLGINASTAKQHGKAEGEMESQQTGDQKGKQESSAKMKQTGKQEGTATTDSTSSTVKFANKPIQVLLEMIEEHLKRIKNCENYGVWSSAAYFLSPSRENSVVAASAYKGIINGEGTSLETSSINTWFKDESVKKINAYLRLFVHPKFHDPDFLSDFDGLTDVPLTTMVNTKELAIQCNIPYKSVAGVSVREMAEFGRNNYLANSQDTAKISIGQIYHMGHIDKRVPVELEKERLREHTFITGSTGSGKSNTIYGLISKMSVQYNIPTLVIEPAKGEYKQIFGKSFNVYGTNPNYTELLRINPFKFDSQIHVLEHIDRLIDIFNVCWPMYAAMPAVLKEAVELAYINAGWDLDTSENHYNPKMYPCFKDVLLALRNVITQSDYSQEVKDNYTGSLITRVKSLTNGLNGRIFTGNEIDEEKLFEENTIIDLSRVGSSETKSMIMGIIIMRLQERRMAQGGINLPLKHLTVLEEAHNILKRTSTEQSSETSNLLGKSVEMIANAIAEMRTYGEAFVIADQAPALLDMSVIRNTNTKIILRLPDETDRILVGKSAGLNDDQIIELAKIPTGVAAVYQNKWVEPVLCQVEEYKSSPVSYIHLSSDHALPKDELVRNEILQYILADLSNEKPENDVEQLKSKLVGSNLPAVVKIDLLKLLNKEHPTTVEAIYRTVANCFENLNAAFSIAKTAKDMDEWNTILAKELHLEMETMSMACQNNILECVIRKKATEIKSDEVNYFKWMEHMGRKVV